MTGTYVTIGKVFSVDAMAKTTGGMTLTRAFVQGEGQDELIPAMGKLADKLSAELNKIYSSGQVPVAIRCGIIGRMNQAFIAGFLAAAIAAQSQRDAASLMARGYVPESRENGIRCGLAQRS